MSFNIRLDVDPVMICPYDSSHRIARSRIQRHLVKCEKNFPPDYKQQCPYDATHRHFEHEMIDHITNCPMKFTASGPAPSKQPEIEPLVENHMEEDDSEVWDGSNKESSSTNAFNEAICETINITQYTTVTSIRGNALIPRRYGSKLRRPFGFSESMMLDTSGHESEDDTQSISSEMGIGRGQVIYASRGKYTRGVSRVSRRGFGRGGRLLH